MARDASDGQRGVTDGCPGENLLVQLTDHPEHESRLLLGLLAVQRKGELVVVVGAGLVAVLAAHAQGE